MLENEDSTISEKSNAETSRSHQKEDIFGKYEDTDYGICDDSDKGNIDEDQHYSGKKSKYDQCNLIQYNTFFLYIVQNTEQYNIRY